MYMYVECSCTAYSVRVNAEKEVSERDMHVWSHNTTCSFRVMRVSTPKCHTGKRLSCMFGAITHLARIQLEPRKGKSLVVEQSCGVQIICIHHTVFELCVREKKERRKTTATTLKFSCLMFSTVTRINETLGVYFASEHLKGSHV